MEYALVGIAAWLGALAGVCLFVRAAKSPDFTFDQDEEAAARKFPSVARGSGAVSGPPSHVRLVSPPTRPSRSVWKLDG